MRICVLTPRFPFPETGGDVLRINNIARHLKAEGHELTLVSFYERCPDLKAASGLYDHIHAIKRSRVESVSYSLLYLLTGRPLQCGYYHSRRFWRLFKSVMETEKPERYIAHLLRMTPYLEKAKVEKMSTVEMTDALSRNYQLASKTNGISLKRSIYAIEKPLIKRYEKAVLGRFPKVVVVSRADKHYLENITRRECPSLFVYTNGVRAYARAGRSYDTNKICFIGNMRTLQNQDAVMNFAANIFPIIKRQIPGATFHIVGAEPPRFIRELARTNKSIYVTGYVESPEEYISDSCVAVAPVRIASGIQNKVLIAMGCELPVVITSLLSASIPELTDGLNCLIAKDQEEFALKCVSLMRDHDSRDRIAKAGYDLIKKKYSWGNTLKGY